MWSVLPGRSSCGHPFEITQVVLPILRLRPRWDHSLSMTLKWKQLEVDRAGDHHGLRPIGSSPISSTRSRRNHIHWMEMASDAGSEEATASIHKDNLQTKVNHIFSSPEPCPSASSLTSSQLCSPASFRDDRYSSFLHFGAPVPAWGRSERIKF